jgi:agmatinase
MKVLGAVVAFAAVAAAHGDHGHDQAPIAGPHKGLWYNTLPGDGGTQVRSPCLQPTRLEASN